jgi:hypothetical protein
LSIRNNQDFSLTAKETRNCRQHQSNIIPIKPAVIPFLYVVNLVLYPRELTIIHLTNTILRLLRYSVRVLVHRVVSHKHSVVLNTWPGNLIVPIRGLACRVETAGCVAGHDFCAVDPCMEVFIVVYEGFIAWEWIAGASSG